MINYILFDVDNTLYPASSGMGKEMIRRINIYVSRYLGVSVKKAAEMRAERDPEKYDSTLDWLVKKYSFNNTESFFSFIHPPNPKDFFSVNNSLKNMMRHLEYPASILTNAPMEHAERITNYLEIRSFFEHIFDLKFNNFTGKPNKSAYKNVLKALDKKADEVLFIDDIPACLETFQTMGGNILLVDESSDYTDLGIPYINKITELEEYLKNSL